MGFIHIGATFSPLIGGKLACLDGGTYNAMIYMSLMCGMLLIVLGGYVLWAENKIAEFPKLKSTIQVASMLLLINGILAVTLMFHNPFAWALGLLCAAEFLLTVK